MSDVSHGTGTGLREHMLMVSRFLRSPSTVGAVSASSRAMARMMVARIPTDRPVTVVELGPGTGAFTSAIVGRVAKGSRILAIELEQAFVDRVRQKLPSVDIVRASAVDLERLVAARHLAPVDHIVSGLPFASLPMDMTRQILDGIEHVLRPGGTFTTFQYLHGYGLRPGRTFRQEMSRRMGGPPHRRLVLKNFPLAFILSWTRPAHH
jgi:phospholipid N-methyltransferase